MLQRPARVRRKRVRFEAIMIEHQLECDALRSSEARRRSLVELIAKHDARLRRLGCEYGQGYLWAKPVPFDDCARATALMHRRFDIIG